MAWESLTFVRSMFKAFAMPIIGNEQRRKPTPICTTPVAPFVYQSEARMYINTHQEDVFVAVSHSDRSKFAKF